MLNLSRLLIYIVINGNFGIIKIVFMCEDNCYKFLGKFWNYNCMKFFMFDVLVFG